MGGVDRRGGCASVGVPGCLFAQGVLFGPDIIIHLIVRSVLWACGVTLSVLTVCVTQFVSQCVLGSPMGSAKEEGGQMGFYQHGCQRQSRGTRGLGERFDKRGAPLSGATGHVQLFICVTSSHVCGAAFVLCLSHIANKGVVMRCMDVCLATVGMHTGSTVVLLKAESSAERLPQPQLALPKGSCLGCRDTRRPFWCGRCFHG
jgi:hypothetical protein